MTNTIYMRLTNEPQLIGNTDDGGIRIQSEQGTFFWCVKADGVPTASNARHKDIDIYVEGKGNLYAWVANNPITVTATI